MTKLALQSLIKNSFLAEKEKQKWVKSAAKLTEGEMAELVNIFQKEEEQEGEVKMVGQKRLNQINQKYFNLLKKLKREKVKGAYRRTEAEEREAEGKKGEGLLEKI